MIKVTATALAGVMALGMLTACGGSSDAGDNDGDGGYYRIYCIGGCQESKSGNQRREQAVFVHE